MGTRDPRVDAYIEKSRDFARPILSHVRESVHAACPDVEETMKWGFPHFMYHGILGSMASFKEHCGFGFWKGALVLGDDAEVDGPVWQFGRLTSVADLPPDAEFAALVRRAMELNEQGVPAPNRSRGVPAATAEAPDDLLAALRENGGALEVWEGFPPGKRRDYVEWLADAKTDATRRRRLATAVEWIAEGKSRNWKYERPRK